MIEDKLSNHMLDHKDYEKTQYEAGFAKRDLDSAHNYTEQKVVISKINIPFTNLVWFLVELSIAVIPAAIILVIIASIFWGIISGLFSGLIK